MIHKCQIGIKSRRYTASNNKGGAGQKRNASKEKIRTENQTFKNQYTAINNMVLFMTNPWYVWLKNTAAYLARTSNGCPTY